VGDIAVVRESLLGIGLVALTPAWGADAFQPLDIRPGLWEITLTVRSSGQPPMPPEVAANLTAEQRARIDAKARERAAAGPQTTVKRSCLDQKELQGPLTLMFRGEGQGCRQTVVSTSRRRQEVRVDCGKGDTQGGGKIAIEAQDPENVKVRSQWVATDGSRKMEMSSTATLRWLGAACEGEPPVAPRAAQPQARAAIPATGDAVVYYKLGREQTARNDFWAALKSLNRAIELDPGRAIFYNARGYAYLRLQRFANAVVDFSEAIRWQPDYANAYQNRAIARRHLGEVKAADADRQMAAEIGKRK